MAAQVEFEQHRKLLIMMAGRVARRVYAAGARTVQKEDIVQELAIAWVQARDHWQPEYNVPFGPYLMRGMSQHINRWVLKELRQFNIAPMELDSDCGDDGSPHDLIADTRQLSPDETTTSNDFRNRTRAMLSPRAAQFLDILENPPESLVEQLRGMQARCEYARKRGLTSVIMPNRITAVMVMDLMGCDRRARTEIMQEIEGVVDEIHNGRPVEKKELRELRGIFVHLFEEISQ